MIPNVAGGLKLMEGTVSLTIILADVYNPFLSSLKLVKFVCALFYAFANNLAIEKSHRTHHICVAFLLCELVHAFSDRMIVENL